MDLPLFVKGIVRYIILTRHSTSSHKISLPQRPFGSNVDLWMLREIASFPNRRPSLFDRLGRNGFDKTVVLEKEETLWILGEWLQDTSCKTLCDTIYQEIPLFCHYLSIVTPSYTYVKHCRSHRNLSTHKGGDVFYSCLLILHPLASRKETISLVGVTRTEKVTCIVLCTYLTPFIPKLSLDLLS